MMNFIFSGFGNSINFTNTSDKEFKKYLEFSDYKIDWGDGVIQYVNNTTPNFYSHTYAYSNPTVYTITMSGMSPWGWNVLKKDVYIPITGTTIDNPNGNVVFHPMGGNWSATPISYDYIFSGDSECILPDPYFDDFGPIPFYITGYTQSTINDLEDLYKTLRNSSRKLGEININPSRTTFRAIPAIIGDLPKIPIKLKML
jgi:hypothetical protein